MAVIRSFRDVPPGGWRYIQPGTNVRFAEDTYDALRAKVESHRKYKGIATDTLDEDIQTQLCLALDTSVCRPLPGEDYQPVEDMTARLTTGMVVSLNRALVETLGNLLAGKDPFIDKAEADRRAEICRGCPFNKPASACSCNTAYRVVEALVPASRKQAGISVCMACGCSLQAKVNLPLSVVAKTLDPSKPLPPWCWQREALVTSPVS
jgi:hypothetical protein